MDDARAHEPVDGARLGLAFRGSGVLDSDSTRIGWPAEKRVPHPPSAFAPCGAPAEGLMSIQLTFSETWIDLSDAGLVAMYWVKPPMSVGATEHFINEAKKSGMVRCHFRDVMPHEEKRVNDRPGVDGATPVLRRFEMVKEDLEYYCGRKLGAPSTTSTDDDQSNEQQQTGVVGRQRLAMRPVSPNGRATSRTAAWDTIGEHDQWARDGIPPHWSKENTGKEVQRHFRKLIKAGKLLPRNYDHLRENAAGEYELSPDSVDRALE
jgi:hypothetical protein